MNNITTTSKSNILSAAAIEKVLLGGDLKTMAPNDRLAYYNSLCESVGFNPLTRPLDYLELNGKLVLYVNKGGAEQLRQIHKVSLRITAREKIGDVYVVTSLARLPDGREDESTGAVPIQGLSGERLANAYLKCETKAKRRVTLSICGMNMLDESEVDSIDGIRKVTHEEVAVMPVAAHVDLKPIEGDARTLPAYSNNDKTLYPSKFPEHLAVQNGQRRFIEDFASDELLQAADSLNRWKTGPKASTFTAKANEAYELIKHLMTRNSGEREMDNELDAALAWDRT